MTKFFLDDGVIIVHGGGRKEFLYPVEYAEIYGLEDKLSYGAILELKEKYSSQKTESPEQVRPEHDKNTVAAYWELWKKSIMLCAELVTRRERNKATGYLPKELNDTWHKLSEVSRELGLWGLDERMTYRLEQDLCSEFQRLYVKLVKECSDRGEAVSAAAIYEMAHAAA